MTQDYPILYLFAQLLQSQFNYIIFWILEHSIKFKRDTQVSLLNLIECVGLGKIAQSDFENEEKNIINFGVSTG